MKYIQHYFIKFIIIVAVLSVVFNSYGLTAGQIFLMTVLLSISYIGDVFLLPRLSDWLAAVLDFFMIFIALWIISAFILPHETIIVIPVFTAASFITMGEILFHVRMKNKVLTYQDNRAGPIKNVILTEFSDDMHLENRRD